jgi:hypothetical protein
LCNIERLQKWQNWLDDNGTAYHGLWDEFYPDPADLKKAKKTNGRHLELFALVHDRGCTATLVYLNPITLPKNAAGLC